MEHFWSLRVQIFWVQKVCHTHAAADWSQSITHCAHQIEPGHHHFCNPLRMFGQSPMQRTSTEQLLQTLTLIRSQAPGSYQHQQSQLSETVPNSTKGEYWAGVHIVDLIYPLQMFSPTVGTWCPSPGCDGLGAGTGLQLRLCPLQIPLPSAERFTGTNQSELSSGSHLNCCFTEGMGQEQFPDSLCVQHLLPCNTAPLPYRAYLL